MPYVNIKVTREGTAPGTSSTTPEQKAALIKGVSDLLFEVLGKPRNTTFVVIDEVELDSWGLGGLPVLEYRELVSRAAPKDE
jgi:4-oxalocrotonate tautomerase